MTSFFLAYIVKVIALRRVSRSGSIEYMLGTTNSCKGLAGKIERKTALWPDWRIIINP